jgi:CheY-like chemotaxis protein
MIDRVHPLLVLEDDPDDVSFIRRAMEKAGIANPLVVRTRVHEAREYLEGVAPAMLPALCIVDLHLPNGETGLDFVKWLRRRPSPLADLPVMIFTVSASPKHKRDASDLRAVTFLTKPITEKTLTDAAQALGFVITSNVAGMHPRRVIERR